MKFSLPGEKKKFKDFYTLTSGVRKKVLIRFEGEKIDRQIMFDWGKREEIKKDRE